MLCEGVSQAITQVLTWVLAFSKFGEIVQANMFRHSRPHFANNDYGTAELACSTAHAHHKVLVGHGLLCTIGLYAPHLEKQRHYCCQGCVLFSHPGGENIAICHTSQERGCAWLPCQPGENKCIYSSYISLSLLPAS